MPIPHDLRKALSYATEAAACCDGTFRLGLEHLLYGWLRQAVEANGSGLRDSLERELAAMQALQGLERMWKSPSSPRIPLILLFGRACPYPVNVGLVLDGADRFADRFLSRAFDTSATGDNSQEFATFGAVLGDAILQAKAERWWGWRPAVADAASFLKDVVSSAGQVELPRVIPSNKSGSGFKLMCDCLTASPSQDDPRIVPFGACFSPECLQVMRAAEEIARAQDRNSIDLPTMIEAATRQNPQGMQDVAQAFQRSWKEIRQAANYWRTEPPDQWKTRVTSKSDNPTMDVSTYSAISRAAELASIRSAHEVHVSEMLFGLAAEAVGEKAILELARETSILDAEPIAMLLTPKPRRLRRRLELMAARFAYGPLHDPEEVAYLLTATLTTRPQPRPFRMLLSIMCERFKRAVYRTVRAFRAATDRRRWPAT